MDIHPTPNNIAFVSSTQTLSQFWRAHIWVIYIRRITVYTIIMLTQSYQLLIQRGLLLLRSEQGCLLQKLCTFEGWTPIHYDFSVVSMLWIWNLYLPKMDRAKNPPSTESVGLYPSLYNAEQHLHSVLSVGSTLLVFGENEGWKLQNLVWTMLLPPTLALHMSHLHDAK